MTAAGMALFHVRNPNEMSNMDGQVDRGAGSVQSCQLVDKVN